MTTTQVCAFRPGVDAPSMQHEIEFDFEDDIPIVEGELEIEEDPKHVAAFRVWAAKKALSDAIEVARLRQADVERALREFQTVRSISKKEGF